MSQLEVLVEETSAERALRVLLPSIVPGMPHQIATFNGRPDLLRKLPDRLAGYASWMRRADLKVMVMLDRDQDDCIGLKSQVEERLAAAGLVSLSARSAGQRADACTRIVVEELEAWFIGDVAALRGAYPRIPATLGSQRRYRDPDAVTGGTAETLARLLLKHGYGDELSKVATAEAVAPHMNVETNRSASFQAFRDGVRRLVSDQGAI